ncbi:MAG: hypothetical protein O3A93_03580 [Chloroflexi bacterium]|nr:hypothetical protein [Chloroflexota bacterium]MDA1270328.1 hypothetical protein [Chloroflexota bacterium]
MATMIDGESYLGKVLVRPLNEAGDVTLYLWPVRCLKSKMGGPTFGVDVKGEEVIRYDPHGPRGHWHKGGYDKLGAGGSHVEFPDDVRDIEGQIAWGLAQIKENGSDLLAEAGFPDAAKSLDQSLIGAAQEAIKERLAEDPGLISKAVDQGLINA